MKSSNKILNIVILPTMIGMFGGLFLVSVLYFVATYFLGESLPTETWVLFGIIIIGMFTALSLLFAFITYLKFR